MTSPNVRPRIALVSAAVTVALLAGCSNPAPEAAPVVSETPTPTATATPTPTVSATPSATATSTPEAQPTRDIAYATCEDAPQVRPAEADEVADGTIFGLYPTMLVDSGPRPGAEGEVTLDPDGYAASYLVVEGDSKEGLAARFCLGPLNSYDYIDLLNVIRRERQGPIYPGDTLNLSPYTMTTVGDIQGVVNDNDVSYLAGDAPLPPQR